MKEKESCCTTKRLSKGSKETVAKDCLIRNNHQEERFACITHLELEEDKTEGTTKVNRAQQTQESIMCLEKCSKVFGEEGERV